MPQPTFSAQSIHDRLTQVLQPLVLQVLDESAQHRGHAGGHASGVGTHFRVCITAPCFAGLRPLQRHRLVYDALQDFLAAGLHALAIEATVPNSSFPSTSSES